MDTGKTLVSDGVELESDTLARADDLFSEKLVVVFNDEKKRSSSCELQSLDRRSVTIGRIHRVTGITIIKALEENCIRSIVIECFEASFEFDGSCDAFATFLSDGTCVLSLTRPDIVIDHG